MKLKITKRETKKEVLKVEPKGTTPKEEIAHALYKIALFKGRRATADTPERLKECDFWIAHFTKVKEDLEK